MNPHLRYVQSIPGQFKEKLTSLGILESRQILRVLDAVTLIEDSNCLSKKDIKKLEKWIAKFNDWLYNNEFCYQEKYRPNNHGTYYDYQVVGYFIYLNEDEKAEEILKAAQYTKLASHIGSNGQNFHELERTRPLYYSIFDLEAFVGLAVYEDRYENINFDGFVKILIIATEKYNTDEYKEEIKKLWEKILKI